MYTSQFRAVDLLYGNRCLCCGDRYAKRIPVSVVPDSYDVSNIQPLCESCAAKEPIIDYRVEAWRVYFLVDTCWDEWEWE